MDEVVIHIISIIIVTNVPCVTIMKSEYPSSASRNMVPKNWNESGYGAFEHGNTMNKNKEKLCCTKQTVLEKKITQQLDIRTHS